MNQIICTHHSDIDNFQDNVNPKKRKSFPKVQVLLLCFVSLFTLVYSMYFNYGLFSSKKLSNNLIDSMGITTLYENSANYSVSRTSSNKKFFMGDSSFSVIGIIDIKKIDVHYPILSDVNNDFLKIAPCRFCGPMPNEVRKFVHCWS